LWLLWPSSARRWGSVCKNDHELSANKNTAGRFSKIAGRDNKYSKLCWVYSYFAGGGIQVTGDQEIMIYRLVQDIFGGEMPGSLYNTDPKKLKNVIEALLVQYDAKKRFRVVTEMRYGLNGHNPQLPKDIAKALNVTTNCIYPNLRMGLRVLRHPKNHMPIKRCFGEASK
jgi:hypothetical protein